MIFVRFKDSDDDGDDDESPNAENPSDCEEPSRREQWPIHDEQIQDHYGQIQDHYGHSRDHREQKPGHREQKLGYRWHKPNCRRDRCGYLKQDYRWRNDYVPKRSDDYQRWPNEHVQNDGDGHR